MNSEEQFDMISYYKDYGQSSRENVYKQIHKTCNGKYKIIDEYQKSSGGTYVPYGKYGGGMVDHEKVYIKFFCVK